MSDVEASENLMSDLDPGFTVPEEKVSPDEEPEEVIDNIEVPLEEMCEENIIGMQEVVEEENKEGPLEEEMADGCAEVPLKIGDEFSSFTDLQSQLTKDSVCQFLETRFTNY